MATKRATNPGFRDRRYRAVIGRLKQRRKELGLSQDAIAARLGLHKQFISRVELGERRLDIVEFVDFSIALGLSPAELVATVVSEKADTEG